MKMQRPKMVEVLPPAQHGTARIDHIELSRDDLFLDTLSHLRNGTPFMVCQPGKYARLITDRGLQMSDTDMEWRTNDEFLRRANGKVLVAGLGLGFVLLPLCQKTEVQSVTVVEINPDVIALVHPKIAHPKLTVKPGDIFSYREELNGEKFDTIYFDVWGDLNTDNLQEMYALRKKYSACLNRKNPEAWIGAWSKTELQCMKRRGW